MKLTLPEVTSFFASKGWAVMQERLALQLEKLDGEMENPDPYLHGRACGARASLRMVLSLEKILSDEASGKSPYGNG